MKSITFYGSGVEDEKVNINPEIQSVVKYISKYYGEVIFGGTDIGLMGKFARAAKQENMKIKSIVPKWFEKEYSELIFSASEVILTKDLSERKKLLNETDTVIIYPGGVGTLDEFFDLIAKISLGEKKPVPIIIYNFERFFSPVLLQLDYSIRVGLIKKELLGHIHTFESLDKLEEILDHIKNE